jgi:hypothetical protein
MEQTSIRIHENPTSGFGVVPCGRTDRLNETNGRFWQLYEQTIQISNYQLSILLLLNIMKTQSVLLHGYNNFVYLVREFIGQLVYWWVLRLSLVCVSFDMFFGVYRQVS